MKLFDQRYACMNTPCVHAHGVHACMHATPCAQSAQNDSSSGNRCARWKFIVCMHPMRMECKSNRAPAVAYAHLKFATSASKLPVRSHFGQFGGQRLLAGGKHGVCAIPTCKIKLSMPRCKVCFVSEFAQDLKMAAAAELRQFPPSAAASPSSDS